jgi:pectinesterase
LRSGRQYFENCYIEGEVDFICGGATALFPNCHIHSLFYKDGGYVTAAAPSDTKGAGFNNGYVFKDCLLTVDPGVTGKNIYLGRGAWTGGSDGGTNQAKVVFITSKLHPQIQADAWTDWDNVSTAAKQFFREYKNTGEGSVSAETATRKFLTAEEYKSTYSSTQKILGFNPKMPY